MAHQKESIDNVDGHTAQLRNERRQGQNGDRLCFLEELRPRMSAQGVYYKHRGDFTRPSLNHGHCGTASSAKFNQSRCLLLGWTQSPYYSPTSYTLMPLTNFAPKFH